MKKRIASIMQANLDSWLCSVSQEPTQTIR